MTQEAFEQENFERWQASLRNYVGWLSDVVPGATDGDCIIHASTRPGDRFLFFEFKSAHERLKQGQRILLDALAKQPGWTVVVVYGPDSDGKYLLTYGWHGLVTKDELTDRVGSWWATVKGTARAA